MKIERIDNLSVVTFLDPELKSFPQFQSVATQLTEMIDSDCAKMLVDMNNVEWMSSVFVGLLVMLDSRLRKAGGEFALCHIRSRHVSETIQLLNVDFRYFETRDEAIAELWDDPDTD